MSRETTIPNPEQVEHYLERERDPEVRGRLVLLNLVAKLDRGYTLAEICELLKIPMSTAMVWIRRWREEGYPGIVHPWQTTGKPVGRPPKLSEIDLALLERRLASQPHWQTKEVVALIESLWGVKLSARQVARILKEKLHVPFGKPYPHDYRRPADAEEQLEEALIGAYNRLMDKGYEPDDIALGFVDESSPQTTANTVRLWHVGPADRLTNTSRYKANAIGFYALVGNDVGDFLPNSKQESIQEFLYKIREANPQYPAIIVILDNFSSHKARRVKKTAVELNIELVYLPVYSPDLNPIEFIWKTVKRAVSLQFIHSLDELRQVISQVWHEAAQKCSYAKRWIEMFVPNIVNNRQFCH